MSNNSNCSSFSPQLKVWKEEFALKERRILTNDSLYLYLGSPNAFTILPCSHYPIIYFTTYSILLKVQSCNLLEAYSCITNFDVIYLTFNYTRTGIPSSIGMTKSFVVPIYNAWSSRLVTTINNHN